MRLLLLAQFFPPDIGGEERHVFNLANTLANRGHEVAVATQCVAGLPQRETLPSGVRVHRFITMAMGLPGVYATDRQHHLPFPDPLGTHNLARILRWERPDVVHAHNWIINSILPLRRRTARHAEFGLVLTLHDYSNVCATKRLMQNGSVCAGPRKAKCVKCAIGHYGPIVGSVTATATAAMRPWKERAIDYIVSVSRAVATGNGIIDSPTARVIPNFILDSVLDDACVASSETAQPELPIDPFLLFVGDLSSEKGVPTLLRAYSALGPSRPPLVLVGKRTPDTPTNLPRGAEMHFEWAHENIMVAFRRCLAAVLPSVWPDPCPTTVLEAMASGRPVITTSTGGMVDMIIHEESGLLVPPGDKRALTASLERLLGDGVLRMRIGIGARERVRLFTASTVAEQLEAIYELVAPPSPTERCLASHSMPIEVPSSSRRGAV